MRRAGVTLLLAAMSLGATGHAQAGPKKPAPVPVTPSAEPSAGETPWSKGVPEAAKQEAQQLLEAGNALFLRGQHREALETYRKALTFWDHPAIRFNIGRVLINLDKPLEALENLELALRYGNAPLEEQPFREAENYRSLLEGRVSTLELRCAQADVEVALDGKSLLRCPGAVSTRVLAGEHQVTARSTKAGLVPASYQVIGPGGGSKDLEISLVALTEVTVKERRWAYWKPWVVVGAGAFVAGIGTLVTLQGQSDYDRFDRDLAFHCGDRGCQPEDLPASVKDLESRAALEGRIGVGLLFTGAAVGIAGVALAVLNRERPVIRETPSGGQLSLVPTIGEASAGLGLRARF